MTGVLKVDDIQDAGANSIVSSNGSGTLTLGSFTAPISLLQQQYYQTLQTALL